MSHFPVEDSLIKMRRIPVENPLWEASQFLEVPLWRSWGSVAAPNRETDTMSPRSPDHPQTEHN